MAVVTPTDRPKSVRNRCVIEVFGDFFVLSVGFRISVGIRVFLIGLSQIILQYEVCLSQMLQDVLGIAIYSATHN